MLKRLLLSLPLLFLAPGALAQSTTEIQVLLDSSGPDGSCSVTIPGQATVTGVDARLVAEVDRGVNQVAAVTLEQQ